ncbi:hypothetical protein DKT68_28970, partial [Micromonospora acroterricola]
MPRRYVPPPPSEPPVTPAPEQADEPVTGGPAAWFNPAQEAESDQDKPETDRQPADASGDRSTDGGPSLSSAATSADRDPWTPDADPGTADRPSDPGDASIEPHVMAPSPPVSAPPFRPVSAPPVEPTSAPPAQPISAPSAEGVSGDGDPWADDVVTDRDLGIGSTWCCVPALGTPEIGRGASVGVG